jgi:hypothetical protein
MGPTWLSGLGDRKKTRKSQRKLMEIMKIDLVPVLLAAGPKSEAAKKQLFKDQKSLRPQAKATIGRGRAGIPGEAKIPTSKFYTSLSTIFINSRPLS